MNLDNVKVVLASKSPRRKELLSQIGIDYEVIPAVGEEVIGTNIPEDAVALLALNKATEILEKSEPETLIIGADTIVFSEGKILGKPKDEADAFNMIKGLQGRTHSVFTGVAIIFHGKKGDVTRNFSCETKVRVYPMSDLEIQEYIKSGEPMDKAGAYGIQGLFAKFIEGIDGDYNSVVGLPVAAVYQTINGMEV